ncbi:hypothetical protein KEM54_001751 [Ascosphaera aggregata]|nr:hypothetical protein KEM54_001751 [Ascosphaera aggregata]
MTRMRSLTTGSEGVLNPVTLDTVKYEHEIKEKDRPRESTLITLPSRPVVERRWTDQQQPQQQQYQGVEDTLPRRTSHSQIQASVTARTPTRLASTGTTPAASSMTFTLASSKGTSPFPNAEKARSVRSVKSHQTLLGDCVASTRTGFDHLAENGCSENRAGKAQAWLNQSFDFASLVHGVSPCDVDCSYKEDDDSPANFKFEVSIDNTDDGQLGNSCQQCLGSEKQAFLDIEDCRKDGSEHSERRRLASSCSSSCPQESPTLDDSALARQLFETDDPVTISMITNGRPVVAWLGSPNGATARRLYMQHFNWTNLNIVNALRSLCSRIPLKGEGQQVDRVLESFSWRWCECNPNHLFKSVDVVHTISYSLLLLNTDLHFAENETKMTRGQFVRNTMPIIQRQVTEQSALKLGGRSRVSSAPNSSSSTNPPQNYSQGRPAFGRSETESDCGHYGPTTPLTADTSSSSQALTVPGAHAHNHRERSANKAWDAQIESVLKEFYNMIQKHQLPLKGTENARQASHSDNPNSPFGGLRRTPSVVGKSGTDGPARSSRGGENLFMRATNANKWVGKARSRPKLYPPVSMNNRNSLDDHNQRSPAYPSAARGSKHSLGRMALSSPSMESVDSAYPMSSMGVEYQQAVGFANALGHAIAKDDRLESPEVDDGELSIYDGANGILDDESLELCGAPWIKEGNVKHKHDLDDTGKRSKDRNWTQCFAVVQRGWLRLFSFDSSSTAASKSRSRTDKHGKLKEPGKMVVGGGNWLESAEEITAIRLRQTVATAFPIGGYSRKRPHVWALTLPSGAIHLFQVGTDTIVNEFVFTANYWSARLSKEPLTGGISNMEYGWSENVLKHVQQDQQHQRQQQQQPLVPPRANSAGAGITSTRQKTVSGGRPSFHSAMRGSFDGSTTNQHSLQLGDKVHIAEWVPPQQSMVTSGLGEQEQLSVTENYLTVVIENLRRHVDIRIPLSQAFPPRSTQYHKAMNNWERKYQYLLSEHRKCKAYICALVDAQEARKKVYQERDEYKKAVDRPVPLDGLKAT